MPTCCSGDHTVKLSSCSSGKLVRVLSGHRRTPWVVRFHPRKPNLLASGSLDHEVRLWDADTGQCIARHTFGEHLAAGPHATASGRLRRVPAAGCCCRACRCLPSSLPQQAVNPACWPASAALAGKPIASLAFHVSADVLAIGCGHKLYMWEYAAQGKLPVIGGLAAPAGAALGVCR